MTMDVWVFFRVVYTFIVLYSWNCIGCVFMYLLLKTQIVHNFCKWLSCISINGYYCYPYIVVDSLWWTLHLKTKYLFSNIANWYLMESLVSHYLKIFSKYLFQSLSLEAFQLIFSICYLLSFCSIVNSGAYRIINGTCAHTDTSTSTLAQNGKCPELRDIEIPCGYNVANTQISSIVLVVMMTSIEFYVLLKLF